MQNIYVIFVGLLSILVSSSSGSTCARDSEFPYLLCYYTGKISLNETNASNCTHLIFTNATVKNSDGRGGLLLNEGIERDLAKIKESNARLITIFTLNLGKNESAAILDSANKSKHLVDDIVSFLTENAFDGVELNFEFTTQSGGSKEAHTSFVKSLSKSLDSLHRRSKRGSSHDVVEELEDDVTVAASSTLTSKSVATTTEAGKSGTNGKDENDKTEREEVKVETTTVEPGTGDETGNATKNSDAMDSAECKENPWLIVRVPVQLDIVGKKYDLKSLSRHADLLSLSTHSIVNKKEEKVTYHPSRLMGLSDVYNTDSILDFVLGMGAVKSKVIIGLPTSVLRFQLKNTEKNAPGSPSISEPTTMSQSKLCSLFKTGNWTLERDEDLTAPYAYHEDSWLSFDDEISVKIKGKYIILRELAGGSVYSIDDDVNDSKCTNRSHGASGYLTSILAENFKSLARKPRASVLESLQSDVHGRSYSNIEAGVRLSEYRIVRVVDHSGAVHVIRRNTQTQFECSRQGFFSHPLGCNKFYRCVKFDQYSDEYTVFEYDCPAGLAFDERWEVCVWPGSLPNGAPCTGSSEIAPVPRSHYRCPNQEGYYGDPENCRWFFACLDHARDGVTPLTAYEFRCPFGLVFNDEKLACDWPWVVGSCGNRGNLGYVGSSSGIHTTTFLNGGNLKASYGQYGKSAEEASFGSGFGKGFGGVLRNYNGLSGLESVGKGSSAGGIDYIAGYSDNKDGNDRSPFASYPDYKISGGRSHNRGGVILQENIDFGGNSGGPDITYYGNGGSKGSGEAQEGSFRGSQYGKASFGYRGSPFKTSDGNLGTFTIGSNEASFGSHADTFKKTGSLIGGSSVDNSFGSYIGASYKSLGSDALANSFGESSIPNTKYQQETTSGLFGARDSFAPKLSLPTPVTFGATQTTSGYSSSDFHSGVSSGAPSSAGLRHSSIASHLGGSTPVTSTPAVNSQFSTFEPSGSGLISISGSPYANIPSASFDAPTVSPFSQSPITDSLAFKGRTGFGGNSGFESSTESRISTGSGGYSHITATTPSTFERNTGNEGTLNAKIVPFTTPTPDFVGFEQTAAHNDELTISTTVKPSTSAFDQAGITLKNLKNTIKIGENFANSFGATAIGSHKSALGSHEVSYGVGSANLFGSSTSAISESNKQTAGTIFGVSGGDSFNTYQGSTANDGSLRGNLPEHLSGTSFGIHSQGDVLKGYTSRPGHSAESDLTSTSIGTYNGLVPTGASFFSNGGQSFKNTFGHSAGNSFTGLNTGLVNDEFSGAGNTHLKNLGIENTGVGTSSGNSYDETYKYASSESTGDSLVNNHEDLGIESGFYGTSGTESSLNKFASTLLKSFGTSSEGISSTLSRTAGSSTVIGELHQNSQGVHSGESGAGYPKTFGISGQYPFGETGGTELSGSYETSSHAAASGIPNENLNAALGSSGHISSINKFEHSFENSFKGESPSGASFNSFEVSDTRENSYKPTVLAGISHGSSGSGSSISPASSGGSASGASPDGSLYINNYETNSKGLSFNTPEGSVSSGHSLGENYNSASGSYFGTTGSSVVSNPSANSLGSSYGRPTTGASVSSKTSNRGDSQNKYFGIRSGNSFSERNASSSNAIASTLAKFYLNADSVHAFLVHSNKGSSFISNGKSNVINNYPGKTLASSVTTLSGASLYDKNEDMSGKIYGASDSALSSISNAISSFKISGYDKPSSYADFLSNSYVSSQSQNEGINGGAFASAKPYQPVIKSLDPSFYPKTHEQTTLENGKEEIDDHSDSGFSSHQKFNDFGYKTLDYHRPGFSGETLRSSIGDFKQNDLGTSQVVTKSGYDFNTLKHAGVSSEEEAFGKISDSNPIDFSANHKQSYGEVIKFNNPAVGFAQSPTVYRNSLSGSDSKESASKGCGHDRKEDGSKDIGEPSIGSSFGIKYSETKLQNPKPFGYDGVGDSIGGIPGTSFKIIVPDRRPSSAFKTSEKFSHATDITVEQQPLIKVAGIEPENYEYETSAPATSTHNNVLGSNFDSGSYGFRETKTTDSLPGQVSKLTPTPSITTFDPYKFNHGRNTHGTTSSNLRSDHVEPVIFNRTQLIRAKIPVSILQGTIPGVTAPSTVYSSEENFASDRFKSSVLKQQSLHSSTPLTFSSNEYSIQSGIDSTTPAIQSVVEVTPKPVTYHGSIETNEEKQVFVSSQQSLELGKNSPGTQQPSQGDLSGETYYTEQLLENAKPTVLTSTRFFTTTEPYKSTGQTQVLSSTPSSLFYSPAEVYSYGGKREQHQTLFDSYKFSQNVGPGGKEGSLFGNHHGHSIGQSQPGISSPNVNLLAPSGKFRLQSSEDLNTEFQNTFKSGPVNGEFTSGSDEKTGYGYDSNENKRFQNNYQGRLSYKTTISGGSQGTQDAFTVGPNESESYNVKAAKTRQKGRGRQYQDGLASSEIPATNKYEEYEIEKENRLSAARGFSAFSKADYSKTNGEKKTVVVSQTSDANPVLIGKLAGQCSCQSNLLQVKENGKKERGKSRNRGEKPENFGQDDGDDAYNFPGQHDTGSSIGGESIDGSDVDGHGIEYHSPPLSKPNEVVSFPSKIRIEEEAVKGGRKQFRGKARFLSPSPHLYYSGPENLGSPVSASAALDADYAGYESRAQNEIHGGTTSKAQAGAAFDRYGPGGWRSFDETLQGSVDCKRPGLFRHPKYCNKFYACNYDPWEERYTLHVFNCPIRLTYDNSISACNWPVGGPACTDDNLLV